MHIPEHGRSKAEIMKQLESYKEGDLPYHSGRIMAYVYDPGEEVLDTAREAYMNYLCESGLDFTTFPSVMRIEKEVVRMIINLLRGDAEAVGNMTSGGTESILLAMKTARDWARVNRPEIKNPEMILSYTAHPAFHKACAYFGIKPVLVGFDRETFQADVTAMRAGITDNTLIVVGSAPGYAQGVIDPISDIAALAQEKGLWCHVDACVGGLHLSMMRKMGYPVPDFDFTIPGVTSISTDMHKYGYAPKNASVIMYRNREFRKYQFFACLQTTSYALINPTITSSKTAGPMAGAWATLNKLGEEGYRKIVAATQEETSKLVKGISAIDGLRVLGKPDMCLFSFTSETINLFQLAEAMSRRDWYLQPQFSTPFSPYNLHITVNQSSVGFADTLLSDLRAAVEEVKNSADQLDVEVVRKQVSELISQDPEHAHDNILALGGVSGEGLPESMVMINTVLECLPYSIAEELLTEYLNGLYQ
ncbi:MAG TPA: aspartate aminotransferase family protein [Candidatus Hydrogenedentes bacterium]|nr:MAG: Glutamate decarboxylase [Candidatus Hydrogenedentes bacterium ADurb.Bin179]HOH30196.1 aspartate aminotransferase family protein [Candidatus Hydrogenedentota bacterium]